MQTTPHNQEQIQCAQTAELYNAAFSKATEQTYRATFVVVSGDGSRISG
jgi:hypothetical protein